MPPLVVKGKNIEVSEPLHSYVEKKLGKLDRLLDKITAVTVELSSESTRSSNDRQKVQVTVLVNGQILRAEESAADMFVAVDAVVDKLQRSIERYKAKLYRKTTIRKNRRTLARGAQATTEGLATEATAASAITRTKRFPIKPMSPEEATEQMELLGHDFYVFYNQDSGGVSVVYKRENGTYGLLIPELA